VRPVEPAQQLPSPRCPARDPRGCPAHARLAPYVGTATLPHMDQPIRELRLTPKMAAILRIFLEDPQQPRYGFELMRTIGQPSGTLYPLLATLERAGWLTGGKEDIDPRTEGRPARHFYRLTAEGALAAHHQLAALSEQYRPPAMRHSRLIPRGGTA
jgi:PadR family transcriptional regulator, regulatory protein PadR